MIIFKNGNSTNQLLAKLGSYQKNKEAIDYLIEAKYLEPFMSINFVETPDSFYYTPEENAKNATQLDYNKTISALTSLYNAAKIPEIKLRYGFQLVRFNHYTRNYAKSTEAFKKFVEPLKLRSAPYYLALDQLAGAQRGLKMGAEANWNFFQVFIKSKSRKESAFISMQLSDSASFDNLMKRAQTDEEKNMAYFLLGYEDFSNPIPMMEKMYDIDPNSEILKVLAARSINELERRYLPTYYYNSDDSNNADNKTKFKSPVLVEEHSFWQKVKNWFSSLFSSSVQKKNIDPADQISKTDLLKNPDRIPVFKEDRYSYGEEKSKDFAADLKKISAKIKGKSEDEFWQIADAYLAFLGKNYEESTQTLNAIKTTNKEYLREINRMQMLNDIAGQAKITPEFEDHLFKNYKDLFLESETKPEQDSTIIAYGNAENVSSNTQEFLRDILANRYLLQGEKGKSFLMNNELSDLYYNPNVELAQSLEKFFDKTDKTAFEIEIIEKNKRNIESPKAFFNQIYGDFAMREANFKNAKKFYERSEKLYDDLPESKTKENSESKPVNITGDEVDNYGYISNLIFGHNIWESYTSKENESMRAEPFAPQFQMIKKKMTPINLAEAAIQLQSIGKNNNEMGAKANQLLGNLMYNTSILGYYRQTFVMDFDNSNAGNSFFKDSHNPFRYYYKNYSRNIFMKPDNFDLSLNFYKKALGSSTDKEQKARILFQMASAEQGKYYQYEANHTDEPDYDDPEWSDKWDTHQKKLDQTKNEKFRTYFAELKNNYNNTQLSKSLQGSCSYYDYFLKK